MNGCHSSILGGTAGSLFWVFVWVGVSCMVLVLFSLRCRGVFAVCEDFVGWCVLLGGFVSLSFLIDR